MYIFQFVLIYSKWLLASVYQIDDDTLLNPHNLVTFLKGQTDTTMNEIICRVTKSVGPIRNPRSKYYVSLKEYPHEYYPSYCQGGTTPITSLNSLSAGHSRVIDDELCVARLRVHISTLRYSKDSGKL